MKCKKSLYLLKMVSFTQVSEFIFLFDNAVVIATQTEIVLRSQDMWIYVFF